MYISMLLMYLPSYQSPMASIAPSNNLIPVTASYEVCRLTLALANVYLGT
jgi:hypothetical protein